ncbi:MAG: pentapeptide repeat-containing protein [Butyricicoccus sp.]
MMDRIKAEMEFQEKCFEPLFHSWIQEVAEQYGTQFEVNKKQFLIYTQSFLKSLNSLQKQIDCEPHILTFSVLWTALLEGVPSLLIEAHEGEPFMVNPILSEKIPAPWLFYHWKQFLESLDSRCGELGLSKYIRYPELRAKAIQAARDILFSDCMLMKAYMRTLEHTTEWIELKKGSFFCLTAGEYMERQYPLVGERTEIDLVYLESGSDARFAKFEKKQFKGQDFDGLVLSDTIFEQCTFQNVSFKNCALCDARLIDCTFEHCRFSNLSLMGAEIYATRLTDTVFEHVWTQFGQSRNRWDFISCGCTSFTNCLLEQVLLLNCEIQQVEFEDCQFIEIQSLNSDLCAQLRKRLVKEG